MEVRGVKGGWVARREGGVKGGGWPEERGGGVKGGWVAKREGGGGVMHCFHPTV